MFASTVNCQQATVNCVLRLWYSQVQRYYLTVKGTSRSTTYLYWSSRRDPRIMYLYLFYCGIGVMLWGCVCIELLCWRHRDLRHGIVASWEMANWHTAYSKYGMWAYAYEHMSIWAYDMSIGHMLVSLHLPYYLLCILVHPTPWLYSFLKAGSSCIESDHQRTWIFVCQLSLASINFQLHRYSRGMMFRHRSLIREYEMWDHDMFEKAERRRA